MVAGFELDRSATGHEMPNQQGKKQTWIALGKLVSTYNFAPCNVHLGTFWTHVLPGRDPNVVILADLTLLKRSVLKWAKWQAQLWRTVAALCFYNFNHDTFASCQTRVAYKTSKSTTEWWLTSNWKNMPLAMKCHINNEKSGASQTQHTTGSPWENCWLPTASFFCTDNLYLQQFWTLLAGSSPKIVFFCTAAFAVEIRSFAPNEEQRHPCKWKD